MYKTRIAILLICTLTIMPASMNAAQRTIKGNALETRLALVIGNGDYKSSPLANPVNDTADMAEALKKLGFEVIHWESSSLTGDFYFAGDGAPVDMPLPTQQPSKPEPVTSAQSSAGLRSLSATLSDDDVKTMLKKHNFFDKDWNKSGDFKNDFKDNSNGTVTDRKTGLMWQQSGSKGDMKYKDTEDAIRHLNRKRLGGYNDWRLPTLEELTSLFERQKMNDGLYIDPVFDKKQKFCWSSDKAKGSSGLALGLDFRDGSRVPDPDYLDGKGHDGGCVRGVRGGQ